MALPVQVEMDPFRNIAPHRAIPANIDKLLVIDKTEAHYAPYTFRYSNPAEPDLGELMFIAYLVPAGAMAVGDLRSYFPDNEVVVKGAEPDPDDLDYHGDVLWGLPGGGSRFSERPEVTYTYPYVPDNFDCAKFLKCLREEFEIPADATFRVWMRLDAEHKPILISCVEDLIWALHEATMWIQEGAEEAAEEAMEGWRLRDNKKMAEMITKISQVTDEWDDMLKMNKDYPPARRIVIYFFLEQDGLEEAFMEEEFARYRLLAQRNSQPYDGGGDEASRTVELYDEASHEGEEEENEEEAEVVNEEEQDEASSRALSPEPELSILQTLDTNAGKGDAMEGDLHAVLPEAASPTEEEWRACCSLLGLDAEAHKDAQALSIPIPGTEMHVKPSQLWTAYWMLTCRSERDACGGVLADVMGTGKTYVSVVVCLLRALVSHSMAEVKREWEQRDYESRNPKAKQTPKQHLEKTSSVAGGGASTPCPCGNASGIECYANPGGVTRHIGDSMSRGAALILAGPGVLEGWVKVLKAAKLQHRFFEPYVFTANRVDGTLTPPPALKQKLRVEARPLDPEARHPKDWTPAPADAVYSFAPNTTDKGKQPERFIFLASHTPDKFTAHFDASLTYTTDGPGKRKEKATVYGCPVGIQLVDEFHKARRERDRPVTLAAEHKHMWASNGDSDNFDFWAVTGTPMPDSLLDLASALKIIQRAAWDDAAHRHHGARTQELALLDAAYRRAIAADGTPADAAEFRSRVGRLFGSGLVARHTEAATFFGRPVFSLQAVAPRVVVHTTPAHLRANVQRVADRARAAVAAATGGHWEQAVRSLAVFGLLRDLEILATFPGAARLMLPPPEKDGDAEAGPIMDFSLEAIRREIYAVKDRDVCAVPLFLEHLDEITADSAHLAFVLETMDRMAADRTRRPVAASSSTATTTTFNNNNPRLKKLVVVCPKLAEAAFLFLALRRDRPSVPAVFFHAGLRSADKKAILDGFESLAERSPRVLVTPFADGGTGLNLLAANYQVQTGPLRLKSHEAQAFGRTNREGQALPLRHALLVAGDGPADRIILATQAGRRILSDPFDLGEELRLEEEEEGLGDQVEENKEEGKDAKDVKGEA